MASRKQIRANRRNARKSTGPRSEAGKAASSANALSHGLTAARTVVLPEEEPEAFERLSQGVVADLAPAGALQQALAQRIAGLLWRLDRVARLEAELFAHGRLAKRRDALARSGTQGLVSRVLAEHLGDKAQESQGELDEMRQPDRDGDADGGAVGTGAGGAEGERARLRPARAPRGDAAARAGPDAGGVPPPARRGGRPRPRLCRRPRRPIPARHPPATRARPHCSAPACRPAGPCVAAKRSFCKTKPIPRNALKGRRESPPERPRRRPRPSADSRSRASAPPRAPRVPPPHPALSSTFSYPSVAGRSLRSLGCRASRREGEEREKTPVPPAFPLRPPGLRSSPDGATAPRA